MELKDIISSGGGGSALPGTIVGYNSTLPGVGILPADGKTFKTSDYPKLASIIPTGQLPSMYGKGVVTGLDSQSKLTSNQYSKV